MGKPRSDSYLDWTNPKTLHWVNYQMRKHPEITQGQKPTRELLDLIISGRDIVLMPGKPNPPPDGSNWTNFLPGDWDAWLFYYESARRSGGVMTIEKIVDILITEGHYSKVPCTQDEYKRACFKIKNEFRKARDRIEKEIHLPENATYPNCPSPAICSECPEYQNCGKVKR